MMSTSHAWKKNLRKENNPPPLFLFHRERNRVM
jgi:hypothetical protein